ncbi:MFS transporter [Bifidobacterium simiarum]|uniref:MFS transporter n=1 Tax=Bifidobacterium simiarum TaxID=2045441 RepID=UPI001BDD93EE|nr:MFS transporter [Bifidobacterium simiarum]MBT1166519.1 MFS transporter [Bifidobacterium simiarum]
MPEFEENRAKTKKALPALLTVFMLGTLMIQAFNLVFQNIGDALGMSSSASLISTLPGIVLGVVCMLYGTLCDFVSPKRMTLFGITALLIGSFAGFLGSFNFWIVLVSRMIQVAGAQVAGSVFLVMAVKYLDEKEKAFYIGLYNAVYCLAAAIGVFAGGIITSFDWKYLFLVPALSIVFIPLLVRNTPDVSTRGERIDGIGIALFAVFAGLIAVYFSFPGIGLIVAAVVFAVLFVLWIWKARNPFLDRSFVTNGAFMSILLVQFLFVFFNYACVPIYNVIGTQIYRMPLTTISLCLTLVYLVSSALGCLSGVLVNRMGRMRTMIVSALLMIIGFIGSALLIGVGFGVLTMLACLFVGGTTLIYAPLYDAASDALPVEQNGRGIGILDLMLNTSASIGIAVYSSLMSSPSMAEGSLFGRETGVSAQAANMFWVMCGIATVALILLLVFRRNFMIKRQR